MHVTDLALNQMLGMHGVANDGDERLLELEESPLVLNHVGTIHASAQFALAEACSGEFLLRGLGNRQNQVFAVLRTSQVKFRRPAHGTLSASARFADDRTPRGGELTSEVENELATRGRALVSLHVTVCDANHVVTMSGQFDWFLQRLLDSPAEPVDERYLGLAPPTEQADRS